MRIEPKPNMGLHPKTFNKINMKLQDKIKFTGKLLNFSDYRKYSPIFIETGTCYGRSVQLAIDAGFEYLKSVEAKEEYYNHCKELFKEKESVELYLGKSIDKLEIMLGNVRQPAVFWLDAHVSGEASAGHQDWLEKGVESDYHQDTAIKKELDIVLKNGKNHIILIDDQNGVNSDNLRYMDIVLEANPNYRFEFIDEQMGETFYKEKILVCIPN